MPPQFGQDWGIVPAAGTNEQLQGATFLSGGGGDGLGSLALEAAELAGQHGQGVLALLGPTEVWQVAGREDFEVALAGADGVRGRLGIGRQGSRSGAVQMA